MHTSFQGRFLNFYRSSLFNWQRFFGLLSWHLIPQGGITQVRFQPRVGQFLAAAAENVVAIFDVESDRKTHSLQVLPMKLV